MIARLVGDLHAKHSEYHGLLASGPQPVIQLGDLDISGYSRWSIPEGRQAWFIDGNHDAFPSLPTGSDRPEEATSGLIHIPRGFVSGNVLFVGGADSVDRDYRIAGRDWFAEESITERDLQKVRSIRGGSIEVVISHCAPASVAAFFLQALVGYGYSGTRSERALDEVLFLHQPRLWVFGHYHVSREVERDGTTFRCLAEGEYFDVDIPLNPSDFAEGGGKLPGNCRDDPAEQDKFRQS